MTLEENLTPMMKQYRAAKADIPQDAILLFRLGDFYEMFFDDATRGSAIMDITLTKRAGVPMCGFPYHALESHLPRLLNAGVKVAIAEQLEDPKLTKGIVKRAVTRIITPGTVVDSSVLQPGKNNFLLALLPGKESYALASLDISTGEFKVTELDSVDKVETQINLSGASECIIPQRNMESWQQTAQNLYNNAKLLYTPIDNWIFGLDTAEELLKSQLQVHSLDGFGCRNRPLAIGAAGAVLYYAKENLRQNISHINKLTFYNHSETMELDAISQRNLELIEPMYGNNKSNTLLNILDKTLTPMGGRMLRNMILRPLYNLDAINARLDAVEAFKSDPLTLTELREIMHSIRDLERIVARFNIGSANGRDLLALGESLFAIAPIKLLLEQFNTPLLEELNEQLLTLPELTEKIQCAIVEEPPLTITDGGIFQSGFNAALDELRQASTEGKNWLSSIQQREQERSGIKTLKIKYNQVFGYYIEISKSNLSNVPEDYIRKQTLVNAERFITPELKELESKILGAEDKAKALEHELFLQFRELVLGYTSKIQTIAAALAMIDALCSLGCCARERNYQRPHMRNDESLIIIGGRHPVLEANMRSERFIPNDVHLDLDKHRMMIITGPNMAGKSTYIRQTAILVLMAQMGSFIPAEEAHIGLVDRIFTRVGAADDLSRGQSTFMVEMVETANILNHATNKSLVILDEIGRGTSTFDGLSIAWAVAEFLHDDVRSHCRTQFATHYHELTELSRTKSGVNNYNVAVREYGDQIIFLRQIVPGGTDKSYGIHVAKLAGLPSEVIDRAKNILESLENGSARVENETVPSSHHLSEDSALYQSNISPDKASRRKKENVKSSISTQEDGAHQLKLF